MRINALFESSFMSIFSRNPTPISRIARVPYAMRNALNPTLPRMPISIASCAEQGIANAIR